MATPTDFNDAWIIPIDDSHLSEGAALFLCAMLHPNGGTPAIKLYEACGAFVARAIRKSRGPLGMPPELLTLLKKVKIQQMDNQLNRAHRSIMRLLITRDHILGGCIKPFVIPLAGSKGHLKIITSRATTREVSRMKRAPQDVQRDRMWAKARKLSPVGAGPMPARFAGTLGPEPIPATHNVVTEDVDPSLNHLIAEAAKQLHISPRNFRRDWPNHARPVLHLIQAMYQIMPEMKRDPDDDIKAVIQQFSPRRLLLHPEWVREAVSGANRSRNWWPALQQMAPALRAINAADLIQLQAQPSC